MRSENPPLLDMKLMVNGQKNHRHFPSHVPPLYSTKDIGFKYFMASDSESNNSDCNKNLKVNNFITNNEEAKPIEVDEEKSFMSGLKKCTCKV